MSTDIREGTVLRKWEFAGKGAAIQLLALFAPFIGVALLGPIGLALGLIALLILFIIGSNQSRVWLCSECRNRLRDRSIGVCPVCNARLR